MSAPIAEPVTRAVRPGRRCALAGCSRRATATIHACGTVSVCEPCRELIEGLAADSAPETVGGAQ